MGYEDLNDHDQLRWDPLLAGKADLEGQDRKRERDRGKPLAGKSTLNRLERSSDGHDRYQKVRCDTAAVDRLLVDVFVEAHEEAPQEIMLDLDVTDTPLHGEQQGRFFHGYYRLLLPAVVHLLRPAPVVCQTAGVEPGCGSGQEVERIVAQIRTAWPGVRIILRGDSGFLSRRVDELVRGERSGLRVRAGAQRAAAEIDRGGDARGRPKAAANRSGSASIYGVRVSDPPQLGSGAAGGSQSRTTRGQGESALCGHFPGAGGWPAQRLYEQLYCARGEMENRIKEQLSLFADRMSTQTLRANQLRLYLSSLAYVLLVALRRLGLGGTAWARAQTETIRRRLLKIGAQLRVTARKVWVSMASGYPYGDNFAAVYQALRPPGSATL